MAVEFIREVEPQPVTKKARRASGQKRSAKRGITAPDVTAFNGQVTAQARALALEKAKEELEDAQQAMRMATARVDVLGELVRRLGA